MGIRPQDAAAETEFLRLLKSMKFIDRHKGIGVGILAAILILILTYSGLFTDSQMRKILDQLAFFAVRPFPLNGPMDLNREKLCF